MGSSYKAPNTNPSKFTDHVKKVISKVQSERDEKELILCMDHNLDLLKCHLHEPTRAFLDNLVEKGVFLTITCPTRIMQTSATLIDNTFVSSKLHRSFDSGILLSDISDHLPSLVLLKQTKLLNKEPLEFTSRNLNEQKLKLINEKLHDIDWNGNLTSSDINLNFDYLSNSIDRVMDEIAPRCTVKISAKRRFELWMSTSLEQSANKENLLYKKMLQENSTPADVKNYKTYRNTYNRIKQHAQETYYQKKDLDFKNNTKKLWNLINKVIRKKGHSGSIIPYITVNGIKITYSNEIATLGSSLAQKILDSQQSTKDYLDKIPQNLHSMLLLPTSQQEVNRIIDSLPTKSSSGHEDASNILLKSLKSRLTYPMTLILNQLLETGTFPERMKLAEVIPLYKNKATDHLVSYRPISLLMTMSKVLEKIVYK